VSLKGRRHSFAIWPVPIISQADFVEIDATPTLSDRPLIFREDSFDATTRVRRGGLWSSFDGCPKRARLGAPASACVLGPEGLVQVRPIREKQTVLRELDERGLFWRPEERIPKNAYAPDSCVAGTLKIDRDGNIGLELDNLLPRPNGVPPSKNALADRFPIIGILKSSKSYIRLEEVWPRKLQLNPRSPSYQVFGSYVCIISSAPILASSSKAYCSEIRLSLEGYEQWLELGEAKVKTTRRGVTAQYGRPMSHIFKLADGLLTIDTVLTVTANDPFASAAMSQQPFLTYKPRKPQTLDGVRELFSQLEDLLILLTDSERGLPNPNVKIKRQRGWATIYFTRRPRPEGEITAFNSWVILSQLGTDFGDVVDRWFAKHEEYGPAFHLYLGCRRGTQLYLEHRFVNLIWGLESLHRQVADPADKSALDAKIARILTAVPAGKDRTWLKGQLKRAGDPALADRLLDLIQRLPLPLDRKQVVGFATTCAARRNEISHQGGHRRHSGYNQWVVGLHPLSNALDRLYHALILMEIGVPSDRIQAIFQASYTAFTIRQDLHAVGITLASAVPKPTAKPSTL